MLNFGRSDLSQIYAEIVDSGVEFLTVDVFDTLFLRKTYPEDLQFIAVGELQSRLLRERLNLDLKPEFLYTLRLEARAAISRREHRSGLDGEPKLAEILAVILESLEHKYQLEISADLRTALHTDLAKIELEMEKQRLLLNLDIIKFLRRLKDKGVQLYFLSDMYLGRQDIFDLLEYFEVPDVFLGGFTSGDEGVAKWSGKLFRKLNELIPGYSPLKAAHIGDHKIADYRSPQTLGIQAFLYKNNHNTGYRSSQEKQGKRQLKLHLKDYSYRELASLEEQLAGAYAHKTELHTAMLQTGFILAPAIIKFLNDLDLEARVSGRTVYLVSAESEILASWMRAIGSEVNIKILPGLNRKAALRTFLFYALEKRDNFDAESLLHLFYVGEGKATLLDILKGLGVKDNSPFSDLELQKGRAEEFFEAVLEMIHKNDKVFTGLKRSALETLAQIEAAGMLKEKDLIIADVGWNGTIQILLEQLFKVLRRNIKVEGIYLGATGVNAFKIAQPENIKGVIFDSLDSDLGRKIFVEEIWEEVITAKDKQNGAIQALHEGIELLISNYRSNLQLSAGKLFKYTKTTLEELFTNPTEVQLTVLGNFPHDVEPAFAVAKTLPLVSQDYTSGELIGYMLLQPKKFYEIYKRQYWVDGFLTKYKLKPFQQVRRLIKAIVRM